MAKLTPASINFNVYESLGNQVIALEEKLKQMRDEQLSDNNVIWNLQLENHAMRQTIAKYAKHDLDCKNYQKTSVDCYCGLTAMLKYFGME